MDAMGTCILEESSGIVQIVSVDDEETIATICLVLGAFIEVLDPCYTNLTISPAFLRISKAIIIVR